ncbi:MAG: sodium:proton antiporter [Candidatus Latescibacteria bacterium]|nr:sodium:proton antiporter [Candidatus Latescibacterota bacterium]NIM21760.1 sodium:proton antiporter [Candidatus Latescibacterota bacterium]NIM65898.1 sodium:proton antiporter [Candidatus Latescibacterota bacterium]NIO02643.1 sodium:proton antiporter [Candidatus Latescibacterota bacterium]NIO29624.1 sodium:proton antiporter [Candidatus Latescibacterota bacterium]
MNFRQSLCSHTFLSKILPIWILTVALIAGLSSFPSEAGARAPGDGYIADSTGRASAAQDQEEYQAEHNRAEGDHEHSRIGALLPIWTILPFIGILLSIALFPLFAPRWWHDHFPKVSAFWAVIFAGPFLAVFGGEAIHHILHTYFIEYFPFIILLWALFTVSGGLYIKGTLQGSPKLNLVFLLFGTVLASWMGTTGASMLLIRPVMRANDWRKAKTHVIVFFIFLVSNIGGSLTPLGDPPLFLGFLHDVPFFWTFTLLPHMGLMVVLLFILFYALDSYYYRKETKPETFERKPVRVEGAHNVVFLLGIIGSVLMSGLWKAGFVTVLGIELKIEFLLRDGLLLLMGILSLKTTNPQIHKDNEFTWFPIKEVAYLFAGIFMTIIPAIQMLKAGTDGSLRFIMESLEEPVHYFWITGLLSSFLDNAPTYLTFFNTVIGKFFAGIVEHDAVNALIAQKELFLKAISVGAVFMGANTYIGNAPNFMVRSIAEEAGIKMPSFFGFTIKYSLPILFPLFILVTLVFFR